MLLDLANKASLKSIKLECQQKPEKLLTLRRSGTQYVVIIIISNQPLVCVLKWLKSESRNFGHSTTVSRVRFNRPHEGESILLYVISSGYTF